MTELTIFHYLFLGLFLFLSGILGTILSDHVIKILISIEFMLTGININFITFAVYCDNINFNGCVFMLFYTAIGAIELAIALFIFYLMFKHKKSDDIQDYGDL